MPAQNWARSQTFHPRHLERPGSTAEVSRIVASAAAAGHRVKAIGSGHSFTAIADTDGILLDLSRLRGALAVDPDAGLVTIAAGSTLAEVNELLAGHGLGLANLGDIDRQTLAGAVSTGTHGTGLRFPSLAGQVVGIRMVLADGSLLDCGSVLDPGPGLPITVRESGASASTEKIGTPASRPDLLDAATIGLGALGVVTAITLRCQPAFDLHAVEGPAPLPSLLEHLDDLLAHNEHCEFYWFPHTGRTLLKRNNRALSSTPRRPTGLARTVGTWWEDELLGNVAFEAGNVIGTVLPGFRPMFNQVASRALSPRRYVDRSDRVFCSPRRVRFREMEYALPRAALPEVLSEIRGWIDRSGELVSFPVEVRFGPADEGWLSTAYRRETAYVAVHQYFRVPYERYFRAVERIVAEVDGRPHWGKLHWLDADRLRQLYPRFEDFRRLRAELDPDGLFGNAYLDRILGP